MYKFVSSCQSIYLYLLIHLFQNILDLILLLKCCVIETYKLGLFHLISNIQCLHLSALFLISQDIFIIYFIP